MNYEYTYSVINIIFVIAYLHIYILCLVILGACGDLGDFLTGKYQIITAVVDPQPLQVDDKVGLISLFLSNARHRPLSTHGTHSAVKGSLLDYFTERNYQS